MSVMSARNTQKQCQCQQEILLLTIGWTLAKKLWVLLGNLSHSLTYIVHPSNKVAWLQIPAKYGMQEIDDSRKNVKLVLSGA